MSLLYTQIFTFTVVVPIIASLVEIRHFFIRRNKDNVLFETLDKLIKEGEIPLYYILMLGVFCTASSLIQIVIPFDLPIIGDLIIAIVNFIVGTSLVLEYFFISTNTLPPNVISSISKKILNNRDMIGFFGIIFNIIHFLFPWIILI